MPQLLALCPLLVGVPSVISFDPPLNHGPMPMTFPRDCLNLSLSETGTRTPGQSGQIHLAWTSFTVLKCHSDEMLVSGVENGLVFATDQHLSREHDQWVTGTQK